MRRLLLALAVPLALPGFVAGCARHSADSVAVRPSEASVATASDDDIRRVASEWTTYRRVSRDLAFAPTLCVPIPVVPVVEMSRSGDEATHGRKLYHLYAADPGSYPSFVEEPAPDAHAWRAPVGQAIVKRTFHPEPVSAERIAESLDVATDAEGRRFRAGEPRELFIMLKRPEETPGTDRGWVYATLTSDGSAVLQEGAIASCMGCHAKAPYDRLFGVRVPALPGFEYP